MSSARGDKAAYLDVPLVPVLCSRPAGTTRQLGTGASVPPRPGLDPFFRGSEMKTLIRRVSTSSTRPWLQRGSGGAGEGRVGEGWGGRPAPALTLTLDP